jgi:DDE family transposase
MRPNRSKQGAPKRRVARGFAWGGAKSECYTRTAPGTRWGQIREERWGQFRVLQPARLIARRIPDLNKTRADDQGELFTVWRYHAAFTDSPFVLVQAEAQHRGHAVIEQVFAELIDGPLAHLPSGRFDANNAWLTCIAIAHNLTRAAATPAGRRYALARPATIRRQMINLAGRIARHARGLTIHLPQRWPWQHPWLRLFSAAHAPPA